MLQDGTSVLMLAASRGDDRIVEMMITYGANVDHRDKVVIITRQCICKEIISFLVPSD